MKRKGVEIKREEGGREGGRERRRLAARLIRVDFPVPRSPTIKTVYAPSRGRLEGRAGTLTEGEESSCTLYFPGLGINLLRSSKEFPVFCLNLNNEK